MSTMIDDREGYNPPRPKGNWGTIRRTIKCAGEAGIECNRPGTLGETKAMIPSKDGDLAMVLRRRIAEAKFDYDHALDRALQLQALGRLARLKAALAGLEAT